LDAPVPKRAIDDFAKGIDIGDEDLTLPAALTILPTEGLEDGTPVYRARLTIREGRYHQVKRMFAAVGCKVVELKRLSIGSLTLEDLAPGEYRKMTAEEIEKLHDQ
jgi:16S rRNA pseudouridine516 synthase